jgi:hypothetical protein
MVRLVWIFALCALAGPALAGSPAAIPDAGDTRARVSFQTFTADWMRKVRALEERHRANPTVKSGASEPLVTYRGYGEDYSVELRPTGHSQSPYVGLLRYTEHVYSCRNVEADRCSIASTVPVTEIFRYQNGRWTY